MITTSRFLGYDKNEYGDLIVNRKEAEIVSLTFDLYLLNVGSSRIGELLDYLGVKTVTGTTWESGTINGMLCNEKYKGDFHLQKYYTTENKRNHTRKEILADTKNLIASKMYQELPDVIMIEDYDIQDVLSQYEDEFVDLTDKVDYDRYTDYKSKLCSKGDRFYGIPFDSGTAALFYRLDILEQAGYTEADMQDLTWERYIEIGEDVYQKLRIPMLTLDPTDSPLLRIIMQSGGHWYVDENNHADIEDNEYLKAGLHTYQQLLKRNVGVSVNGWNEFISAFQNGSVASVISGGWIVSSIKSVEEQSGLWRVVPIPVYDGEIKTVAASNVGGSAWYVLKNAKNPDAAVDFLVEMFEKDSDFMNELIGEIGLLPAVKDMSGYENYLAKGEFFGGQQVTKILTDLSGNIITVNYGSKTYEIEAIVEDEFNNSLTQDNLSDCLSNIQVKAAAVVRE